ncbi:hypothetical protein BHM03_00062112, partial [Ensete ventricosum]
ALALLHPQCTAAVAAPTQATVALCNRQPPYQGTTTPAAGVAAPAGDRAVRGWQPLTGYCPCGWAPLAGGLAAADRPLAGEPWL